MPGEQLQSVPLRHGGRDRPYVLRAPPGAGGLLPLVVELHGRGSNPVRFDLWTGFSRKAATAGFVLALPAGVGRIWNDGRDEERIDPDDVSYLVALIDDAVRHRRVDPARVYMVGMSNGAAMTGRVAIEHGDRLAAVAQVAGTASAALAARTPPRAPVPLLHIHGTADRLAPYEGGARRGLVGRALIRRPWGGSIGVEEWLGLWAKANGASGPQEEPSGAGDVAKRVWTGAAAGNDVVAYRIEGGGHTWPGSRRQPPRWLLGRTSYGIDATSVIWEFFHQRTRS